MSELRDMMEWEKLNKMKPEITTNAKEGEYAVVEMEKDPFYDCRWGQINAVPEHNVYQSWCKLKNKSAECKGCKDFYQKPKLEDPTTTYELRVRYFDESFGPSGCSGDFENIYFSEQEAREELALYIKNHKGLEIWWDICKVEKLASGHLERRDK
jgi:hypothetical protein